MVVNRPYVEQTDPPRSPRETLPTMYDLPSEDPNEPGLPDEYHDLQPELLSVTLRLNEYSADEFFTGTDLNLYYDIRHPQWYKRPDWFLSLGVPRLYDNHDLRLSYVIWQEGVSPLIVVELLSPGTEQEDLGQTQRGDGKPPTKWEVYEQILRIPYYVVYSRYTDQLRAFGLRNARYQELDIPNQKLWLPELKLGLGTWHGLYKGIERDWLRWYGEGGQWILTDTERLVRESQRAEQESQRAEQAEVKLSKLLSKLQEQGIDPDDLLNS